MVEEKEGEKTGKGISNKTMSEEKGEEKGGETTEGVKRRRKAA